MKLFKYLYHAALLSYHVKRKCIFNMNDHPTVMKYHYEKSKYHFEKYEASMPAFLKMK